MLDRKDFKRLLKIEKLIKGEELQKRDSEVRLILGTEASNAFRKNVRNDLTSLVNKKGGILSGIGALLIIISVIPLILLALNLPFGMSFDILFFFYIAAGAFALGLVLFIVGIVIPAKRFKRNFEMFKADHPEYTNLKLRGNAVFFADQEVTLESIPSIVESGNLNNFYVTKAKEILDSGDADAALLYVRENPELLRQLESKGFPLQTKKELEEETVQLQERTGIAQWPFTFGEDLYSAVIEIFDEHPDINDSDELLDLLNESITEAKHKMLGVVGTLRDNATKCLGFSFLPFEETIQYLRDALGLPYFPAFAREIAKDPVFDKELARYSEERESEMTKYWAMVAVGFDTIN